MAIDMSKFGSEQDSGLSFLEMLDAREGIMPPVTREGDGSEDAGSVLDGHAVKMTARARKYYFRRAASESELLDTFKAPTVAPLEEGSVHLFLTKGDIDSLSFLKLVLRMQRFVHYAIISTWCVNISDVLTLKKWMDDGKILKMDLYLGEIYTTGSHGLEASDFMAAFSGYKNVRIVMARNHSKVMAIDGQNRYFFIYTSANINTNSRIESTAIFVPGHAQGTELFAQHMDFFATVKDMKK